jgi:CubicO group peptidase (beta-lactamase class C family)
VNGHVRHSRDCRTRGDKAGLDTLVLKFFDGAKVKHLDDRKRRMTLKDVWTMTSGLEWHEDVAYDDPRARFVPSARATPL